MNVRSAPERARPSLPERAHSATHLRRGLATPLTALSLVLSTTACTADEAIEAGPAFDAAAQSPTERAVDAGYDQLLALTAREAAFFCECELSTTAGPAFEQCVFEGAGHAPPPIIECTKRVFGRDDAILDALSCQIASAEEYLGCLADANCNDLSRADSCGIERAGREASCPDVPWETYLAQQVECYGKVVFECADGSSILRDWVCDGAADCPDGSDEHDCPLPPTAFE